MSEDYKPNRAESVEEAAGADVEAMQAELAELRQQVFAAEAEAQKKRDRGRRWAVSLLIVLGCLLLALANLGFWMRGTIVTTSGWVRAVGPLSRSPVLAQTMSDYIAAQLFDLVEVDQLLQEVLPPRLQVLGGVLSSSLEDLARDQIALLIQSDGFNAAWVAVHQVAHRTVVTVLRHEGGLLSLEGGQLAVDLSGIFEFIQSTLELENLELFGQENWGRFVLLESRQVALVQEGLSLVNTLGLLLPLLALIALFLAWLVSRWRRSTLLWIGIGAAITMGISLILVYLLRPVITVPIADPLVRAIAREIWNAVTRPLVIQTVIVLLVGVLLAAGAALAGPSPRAVAIRGWFGDRYSRLRAGAGR